MYPEHPARAPLERAPDIHQAAPVTIVHAAPLAPTVPGQEPAVQSIVLPDGRVITGYAIEHTKPEPVTAKPAVSRAAVNVALGGVGFLAVSGGLLLLTTFIAALTALIQQLIILAAVIFGGFIAAQIFGPRQPSGTTFNIRKAIFKRNHFHG
ncbi:hypothetical protein AB0C93_30310 [Streptomyces sp. NPDC048518]|uniref:hypothetical protein n=1 Tax=Streptomyces sp. NPDC048518 TaxID=3155029 RepID=UPI0033C6371E